eukprot:GHVS01032370.1.p1 GENE.GHVS01032370.1~~GHVS01032370.1.p1  ORF type:complete len:707 (+),score=144.17 GHVS01032370.1:175-2295(+)
MLRPVSKSLSSFSSLSLYYRHRSHRPLFQLFNSYRGFSTTSSPGSSYDSITECKSACDESLFTQHGIRHFLVHFPTSSAEEFSHSQLPSAGSSNRPSPPLGSCLPVDVYLLPLSAFSGPYSHASAVEAFTSLRPSLVCLCMGLLDYHKVFSSIDEQELIIAGHIQPYVKNRKKPFACFLPLIQTAIIHSTPLYPIARDTASSLTSLATCLLHHPTQLFAIWKLWLSGGEEEMGADLVSAVLAAEAPHVWNQVLGGDAQFIIRTLQQVLRTSAHNNSNANSNSTKVVDRNNENSSSNGGGEIGDVVRRKGNTRGQQANFRSTKVASPDKSTGRNNSSSSDGTSGGGDSGSNGRSSSSSIESGSSSIGGASRDRTAWSTLRLMLERMGLSDVSAGEIVIKHQARGMNVELPTAARLKVNRFDWIAECQRVQAEQQCHLDVSLTGEWIGRRPNDMVVGGERKGKEGNIDDSTDANCVPNVSSSTTTTSQSCCRPSILVVCPTHLFGPVYQHILYQLPALLRLPPDNDLLRYLRSVRLLRMCAAGALFVLAPLCMLFYMLVLAYRGWNMFFTQGRQVSVGGTELLEAWEREGEQKWNIQEEEEGQADDRGSEHRGGENNGKASQSSGAGVSEGGSVGDVNRSAGVSEGGSVGDVNRSACVSESGSVGDVNRSACVSEGGSVGDVNRSPKYKRVSSGLVDHQSFYRNDERD